MLFDILSLETFDLSDEPKTLVNSQGVPDGVVLSAHAHSDLLLMNVQVINRFVYDPGFARRSLNCERQHIECAGFAGTVRA